MAAVTERAQAIAELMPIQAPTAFQLYSTLPGLMCFRSIEVAQQLRGLQRTLGMSAATVIRVVMQRPRLALLEFDALESRIGLIAKGARLDWQDAVSLVLEHPQLALVNSRKLMSR